MAALPGQRLVLRAMNRIMVLAIIVTILADIRRKTMTDMTVKDHATKDYGELHSKDGK